MEDTGVNKLKIIQMLNSELGLGLSVAKTIVEDCPSILELSYPSNKCYSIKKELENLGAKINVKQSKLWTSNKYRIDKIATQDFYKKNIQAFINVIQTYGTNN